MRNLLLCIFCSFFLSCSTKDEPGDVILNEFDHIERFLVSGKWKLVLNENGQVVNRYTDYLFRFYESGALLASKDSLHFPGHWRYESAPFKGETLALSFEDSLFSLLTAEWRIKATMNSKIELISDHKQIVLEKAD